MEASRRWVGPIARVVVFRPRSKDRGPFRPWTKKSAPILGESGIMGA
ncbi:Hypothetical protein A7982_01636 [Minicystis rosea]|nr:Hypothetical protein A7982_01636 [Minicystis rosea]